MVNAAILRGAQELPVSKPYSLSVLSDLQRDGHPRILNTWDLSFRPVVISLRKEAEVTWQPLHHLKLAM